MGQAQLARLPNFGPRVEVSDMRSDHDILITLENEIKHIKDSLTDKVRDHEVRLRKIEKYGSMIAGGVLLMSWLLHVLK